MCTHSHNHTKTTVFGNPRKERFSSCKPTAHVKEKLFFSCSRLWSISTESKGSVEYLLRIGFIEQEAINSILFISKLNNCGQFREAEMPWSVWHLKQASDSSCLIDQRGWKHLCILEDRLVMQLNRAQDPCSCKFQPNQEEFFTMRCAFSERQMKYLCVQ